MCSPSRSWPACCPFYRSYWGTKLFDMDCDSDLDMLVACGHVYGEIDNFAVATGTSYKQRALLLRNGGPPRMRFEDVTDIAGPALQIERVWRGATFGDFDDDGDIDVFMTALNDKPAMFRNDRVHQANERRSLRAWTTWATQQDR